jgi:hypothetical protein
MTAAILGTESTWLMGATLTANPDLRIEAPMAWATSAVEPLQLE